MAVMLRHPHTWCVLSLSKKKKGLFDIYSICSSQTHPALSADKFCFFSPIRIVVKYLNVKRRIIFNSQLVKDTQALSFALNWSRGLL